jgi:hypothetical protein
MERAQRGVKRAQPDTPATGMDRAQQRGRGVNPSQDGAGTAQTPASGRAVGAPGRAGDDGRDGGGCMNPDAGSPCCGPERRNDPSAGQVRAAARHGTSFAA